MWRLKLKETLERFTVLDCKNWTCGTPKVQQQQQQNSSSTVNTTCANDEKSTLDSDINGLIKCKNIDHLSFGPEIFLPRWKICSNSRKNSSSGSSNDNEKRKNRKKIRDNENQLTEDILGAITWSGAIIFGWYASQILCTRRRHLTRTLDDNNKNKYLKYLYIPKRGLYSNVNYVFTSPEQQSTVNISDRIKYVDISLLQNEITTNSKKYKNLINQPENELNLREIINSSQLGKPELERRNSSIVEYSTNSNNSSTPSTASEKNVRATSDNESKLLDNVRSTIMKENENFTKLQKSLQSNNSADTNETSITNTDSSESYSTRNESYDTEDSTSFIVFEEKNSCSSNHKIGLQKNTVVLTDDTASVSHGSISSKTSEIPTLTEAVSDLANYIADFEYNVAVQHIKKKDYKSAVPHLKRASTHMHPNGIYNLGLCYENGLGVRRNLEAAAECYQRASHLGHPKATFNLGVFYAKGLGETPKNTDIARKCIITAAKLGQPEAISFLNAMAVNDKEIARYLKEEKMRKPSIDSGLQET